MPGKSAVQASLLWVLGLSALLLAACAPGPPPDRNGPRNGDGQLVDPRTGISLPGQPEPNGGPF
jgi:hypothetical protein